MRVFVCGIGGRMGRLIAKAVEEDSELDLVGGADPKADVGSVLKQVGVDTSKLALFRDISEVEESFFDVVVDFTLAEAAVRNAEKAFELSADVVMGTTGIPEEEIRRLGEKAESMGRTFIYAPSFSLGAAVLLKAAEIAAQHFKVAEIVEVHHTGKKDSPSGTAITLAKAIAEGGAKAVERKTEKFDCARGADVGGVLVHSLRVPGFTSRHEVYFGGEDEYLVFIHDAPSRRPYVMGAIFALKSIPKVRGRFIFGLPKLLAEVGRG